MKIYPCFLSVVFVIRNKSKLLNEIISEASKKIAMLANDYELIIIDNASTDNSLNILKNLTSIDGIPNLQVYALTKEVDIDTASWVGLENALGDFVVVVDPLIDDIDFLPKMFDCAVSGSDVVFANNSQKQPQNLIYIISHGIFNSLFKFFNGVSLTNEAPQYRLLSKRIVNFILQHPQPALTYRYLPATGGFKRTNLQYSAIPKISTKKRLRESIDRGMRLLVSTTRGPMRMVTSLSLFGAFANVLYSVYIIAIMFLKDDVAPGWISLSLQQSGMFFLISLVLWVLGEYIVNMARLTNEGPLYYVGQEFTSARMTRREKLNIEEAKTSNSYQGSGLARRIV